MHKIKAYTIRDGYGEVLPLSIKRDWMDNTWESHAYKCFPVGLTNQLGWEYLFQKIYLSCGMEYQTAPQIMLKFYLEKNMRILEELMEQ